jgi:hypothetical protein
MGSEESVGMGIDTSVTLRTLQLGAADTVTGWYAKSFAESAIDMPIFPKAMRSEALRVGLYPHYEVSGFHIDPVVEGDEVKDSFGNYYEVELVSPVPLGDSLVYYESSLTKLPIHYDMPTTYGTGASVEDPRHRTKDYLDTYLSAANMKKNDGATAASFLVCWADPPYPMKQVYVTKGIDLVFSLGRTGSNPMLGPGHAAYGYEEKIPITISAIDKTAISGDNLMWQGERELRRVTETYPLGSLRTLDTATPKTQNLGSTTLYSVECTLNYRRDVL